MKKSAFVLLLLPATLLALLTYRLWPVDYGVPALAAEENYPGGAGSVSIQPFASFMLPAANLPEDLKPDFHAGKALAHQPWIKAPTTTDARDGLGPIYNARTCLACHANGGRGSIPDSPEEMLITGVLRLSIPGADTVHGVIPEPVYGGQFQSQSVSLSHQLRHVAGIDSVNTKGEVKPEGYVHVNWTYDNFVYPDGEKLSLRRPDVEIRQLGYGEMHADTLISLRNAPPIHGMGLLQEIPQAAINELADPDDKDGNGISGRVNQVWDFSAQRSAPGRFGLKANTANIRDQVAAAFRNDVGIVSSVFPDQPCSDAQETCLNAAHGSDNDGLEINDSLLKLVVDFNRSLAVPQRRKPDHPMVLKGREQFYRAGCANCHNPSFTTAETSQFPHLSGQTIWPYSDLLLHDMGPDLADGRADYSASGSEWRTAPLWGVGLSNAVNGSRQFLHDGRARSVEEAIVWHGGEAQRSRDFFVALEKSDRRALIAFVRSL